MLREGKVTNYELTALSKDGKRQTVVSYNAVTFNEAGGRLQGVFAAARDITEQKKLEQQLRESEAYNRGLIEASVDGLITVDPAGTISDVNDRMCQMSGYTRNELIGTPFADYFTDPMQARNGVQHTFEAGFVTEYALTLIARGRRLLQVSFNASVFKDQTGAVRGIFASARDITDRVRLEEQLREQQTYLRGLIESSVDGLVTVDPEGFVTDVQRTDVSHDGLCTRKSDRLAVQTLFYGTRARRHRRETNPCRKRSDQLRIGLAYANWAKKHGFLQCLDLSWRRKPRPGYLRLGARHFGTGASSDAVDRAAGV